MPQRFAHVCDRESGADRHDADDFNPRATSGMTAQSGPSPLIRRLIHGLLLLAMAVGTSLPAQELDTRIVVRALANNAKLIGDRAGGARVTIRHADTGAFLAGGLITGDTGDTQLIMSPRERGGVAFDTEGAAAFATSLPIEAPTPIEIVVAR